MKKSLINSIKTPSVADAFDILSKAGEEDIFEKAHNVGDIHPNGKWVWVQLPNGKFDWRVNGGRTHKKSGAGGSTPSTSSDKKSTSDTTKQKKLRPVGTGTLGPTRRTKEEQEKIDKKKKKTTESKKTSKADFKREIIDFINPRTNTENFNISDFITDTKKKGGKYYIKVDYYSMSPVQKREFDRLGGVLKKEGYSVQENGGLGKVIMQKKLRPVGSGTLGPERRTPEAQERIDKKRKEKKESKIPKGHKLNYYNQSVDIYDSKGKKVDSGIYEHLLNYANSKNAKLTYDIRKHGEYNEEDGSYDIPGGYKMIVGKP